MLKRCILIWNTDNLTLKRETQTKNCKDVAFTYQSGWRQWTFGHPQWQSGDRANGNLLPQCWGKSESGQTMEDHLVTTTKAWCRCSLFQQLSFRNGTWSAVQKTRFSASILSFLVKHWKLPTCSSTQCWLVKRQFTGVTVHSLWRKQTFKLLRKKWRDFHDGPVVKTLCFQCKVWGFHP